MSWYSRYKEDLNSPEEDNSMNYLQIGHGREDSPILWCIMRDGRFIQKQVESGYDWGHSNFPEMVQGYDWSGRLVEDKDGIKIISVARNTGGETVHGKTEVEKILREKFGPYIKLKWTT